MSQPPIEPLNYESPKQLTQKQFGNRAVASFFLTVLTSIGFVAFTVLAAYSGRWDTTTFVLVLIGYLVTTNTLAIFLHRRTSGRPWAAGIWSGLLVALLIEGGCFLAHSS